MSSVDKKMNLLENAYKLYEWFCTKTCFDTETIGNLKDLWSIAW